MTDEDTLYVTVKLIRTRYGVKKSDFIIIIILPLTCNPKSIELAMSSVVENEIVTKIRAVAEVSPLTNQ